jgi:hypothetical protein
MTSKEIQASQTEIRRKYGDKLVEVVDRLCRVCQFKMTPSGCTKGLLPLCIDGSDCPYLIRRKNAAD